jgi:hypothetical protein
MPKKIIKISQAETSTHPLYIDSGGDVFSASDIVKGKKVKKPYKKYSLSKRVTDPGFGKKIRK